ncbi:hypothetical protein B5M09_009868 [Aphanomyces astaci]|uniref:Uncharacterized protein n=1 Tax=Aphanomyces astaci TaxID=112090 RepID=A0A425DCA1_APHAT|nr:hypothetical protein B5M09_009868 [Aphanomyces astaci]
MLLSPHPGVLRQRDDQPPRFQQQLPMQPAALSNKRPHKRYKVLRQCLIIAKPDLPHVHSPALQAFPFMQLAHGTLELIEPVKTHPRKLHAFQDQSIHKTRSSNDWALANKRRYRSTPAALAAW